MFDFKELDKSIELLLNEINQFKQHVESLSECEENQINLINKKQLQTTNTNDSNLKKLHEKETEYDQINELYLRNRNIVKNEEKIIDLMNEFQNKLNQIIKQAKMKKEEYADQSNDLLIEMAKLEKKLKGKEYTKEYKSINYQKLLIKTDKLQRMKEEKGKRKEEKRRRKEEKKTKRRNFIKT